MATFYDIALRYDESELNGADESTLGLYHRVYNSPNWVWIQETAAVIDTTHNLVEIRTNHTGEFGLGGNLDLNLDPAAYLPLVFSAYPSGSIPDRSSIE